ncbi:hypothetical protein AB9M62_07540 [Bacillales bacterium AN1005]
MPIHLSFSHLICDTSLCNGSEIACVTPLTLHIVVLMANDFILTKKEEDIYGSTYGSHADESRGGYILPVAHHRRSHSVVVYRRLRLGFTHARLHRRPYEEG